MLKKVLVTVLISLSFVANADITNLNSVQHFIQHMSSKHHFNRARLTNLFHQVNINPSVLEKIAAPYEKKPWYIYRKRLISDKGVSRGLTFWQDHQSTLQRAEKKYGVPADIIIAIIGVETKFGSHPGTYKVIEALSSLAFQYPPRQRFFKKELEHFLLLAREKKLNPLKLTGSYAGAIGIPQFMPSSYRHYAIDFSGRGNIDLQNNIDDVIGSIANYLYLHGWVKGDPITAPAIVDGHKFKKLKYSKKPKYSLKTLRKYGIEAPDHFSPKRKAIFVTLQNEVQKEHWLGFQNFYVITTYNTSPQYAMAVYQFSQQLLALRNHEKI